ncbi:hypothetical protein Sipo8835_10945 [Streptomyces ipomoeae]|uniref:Uncharacterized protein n=1 Tax=Streptomyces ipomoeae TaxID=103232 RepID=A0AAE9B110_9ACTN|nr:hypothetical protein [Streptomyces ipomoeae]MDX2692120.1 hypothetical protein [Streptomyces ipomoeae]MDX2820447.1 hypothetical protein [Streptomyces ipomoeae]MDX2837495.1 hypothetical protein [Streptomyces ipomoeae]MDX2874053.1 hypothetical protein [Streptomyces ipomoeae]TQE26141.1 hypothetical protein Sipo7851_33675 [Streptomyces ipomoeae]
MTRTAGATRVLLARLLMLGLLLIGLGVVHTLAHADAHDGVTGHMTAHHLDLATAYQESFSGHHAHETDTSGEASHRTTALATADADSLPEADCWASVPTGPWPVTTAQLAAGTTTATHAAPPADGLLSCRAHTSPHALGVLRI